MSVGILALIECGYEDTAREQFGDDNVDAVIREALTADGWDPDACFKNANGFEGTSET